MATHTCSKPGCRGREAAPVSQGREAAPVSRGRDTPVFDDFLAWSAAAHNFDVLNSNKHVPKPTNPTFDFDFVVKAQTDVADGATSAVEVTPEVGEIVSKSTESEPIDGREAEVLEPADSA